MADTTNFSVRTDSDIENCEPNNETISAMLEAERIARDPSVKRYSDVEEALEELKAELEDGYADMLAGRTKPAREAFADIRKQCVTDRN